MVEKTYQEKLEKIKSFGVPEINEAIETFYDVIESPEFQELERLREKARHDEAQALHNAEQKERKKWQGIVAEKDAEIEKQKALIDELKKRLGEE